MKNWKILLFLAFVSIGLTNCELAGVCEKGEGLTISRDFDLRPFSSVILDISADVFITQGDAQQVTVEAQENILDLIDTEIESGVWEIDFDRLCVRNHDPIRIFITLPEINRLEINGSGEIISENVLKGENLRLEIDGSGDMDIAVENLFVDARISGSGNIKLEGITEEVGFRVSGSGDILAFNMPCVRADAEISGSGSIEVSVSDFLRARISGSGDIRYRGNPELDTNVSGSGSVKKEG